MGGPIEQDRDIEEIEVDKDLEKAESEPSEATNVSPVSGQSNTSSAKRPQVVNASVPEESEDDHRGRSGSRASDLSIDSQATLPDEAHDHQVPPHRSRSRRSQSRARSSIRSIRRDAVKVPRNERRGLFARFTVMAEVTNPYDYSRRMKWIITAIVALAGAAAPMGSSIILPGLLPIARDFHSTPTIVNLSVAMYMLSMSVFPLWWSSFSETLGRRTIYLVSFFLFLVFNILCAVSTSISMFIVMRILAGGAAASVQAVGAGTIADVWEPKERGRAMGIFYIGPLCGPLISPIIGGILTEYLGWRAAQWFLAIFGGCLCLFILFFLPETLRQRKALAAEAAQEAIEKTAEMNDEKDASRPALTRTSTKASAQVKTRQYLVMLRRAFIDPLNIILYLQIPAVAICVAYSAVTFGTLYVLNISVQQTFSAAPYNYSTLVVGCLYIPNSFGYFLSSVFGGRWVDRIMEREARKAGRYDEKGKLKFIPEDRMQENAWLGAAMFPLALILYGWTATYGVNIAVPMIANFFFGIGSMIVFGLVTTMLTEFIHRKSSNGIALNNFVRNIFSCVGTVATEPLINAIGNGWIFTGLGIICLIAGFLTIWAMKRFGPRWRLTMDKKLNKLMGE